MQLRDLLDGLIVFCLGLVLLPRMAADRLKKWWASLEEFYKSLPEDHWVYHWMMDMNDEGRFI